MHRVRRITFAAFVLMMTSCAHVGPEDWPARTIADVESAHAILEAHSPAGVDSLNPAMIAWHTEGYRKARERAATATSEQAWRYVLEAYVHGYGDPHLSFRASRPLPPARHPGFTVSMVGGRALVSWAEGQEPGPPRSGDTVVSCDDRPLNDLVEERVFPFQFFASLPADRRSAITRLFLDRGNPFAPAPTRCVFAGVGEVDLRWRTVADGDPFWTEFRDASLGPRAAAGLAFPAPAVAWIGAPSFAPAGEDSNALEKAFAALRTRGDAIRAGDAIVVDVRGNTGGSTAMGVQLAQAIWGKSAVDAIVARHRSEAVDWRASRENADYVGQFSFLLRLRFPGENIGETWANIVSPGLARAVREGALFFRQGAQTPAEVGGATLRRPRGASPFRARVFFLTNGTCASACLDFADIALHMPGVLHIGEHTSGDGLLMEVRNIDLASRRGSIQTPIKVVRGRERGALEAYAPDLRYEGSWEDQKVRDWVMQVVAKTAPAG